MPAAAKTTQTTQNNNQNNNNYQSNNNSAPGTGQKRFNNSNYCWTHGYDIDGQHNSSNCHNPSDSHQHGATPTNPMGGSEANMLHATCGYPVPSTWIWAIDNGHFATWPRLTADLVQKHLPKSMATAQGHMHQQRQNIRTTQPTPKATTLDLQPTSDAPNLGTNLVFSAITDAS
jgi:hypothetical protein